MNIKLLDKLVKNGNCFDKMNCVDLKYGLDVLVHEEGFGIREYIASKGYCLDILVNDTSMDVRREVARQGYGLDILINDTNIYVRSMARRILTYLSEKRGNINEPEY